MKKAIITGITGQDGAWLAKCLLSNGYKVYGAIRRNSDRNLHRLKRLGIDGKIKLVEFDLLEYSNILQAIRDIQPDEFYNLAAQSFVGVSFQQPISTFQTNAMGVAYILDILKSCSPKTKFYQASTSEMFGDVDPRNVPLNESSPFHPRSPYGVAKLFAHWNAVNYREAFGMYCCSGILFNHESELRGVEFVTRKISFHVASKYHKCRDLKPLELGNLDAIRDWGYAKEYCEGMWQMMQQDEPDSYVLATGEGRKVREFVESAFRFAGHDIRWDGSGVNEVGYDNKTGEVLVRVNPDFYRPAEVNLLIGCAEKARKKFGWAAATRVEKLTEVMVKGDIDFLKGTQ